VADLIVIDGDPASDIRLLLDPQRIRMVIQGGGIVAESPRARELSAA
jgi:imidazolonepropionase-like amidohydrolase